MLGADYAGYFPWGDAAALAALLLRCRDSFYTPDRDPLWPTLIAQCQKRAPLFEPAAERSALRDLVHELLGAY